MNTAQTKIYECFKEAQELKRTLFNDRILNQVAQHQSPEHQDIVLIEIAKMLQEWHQL
jgi:hypothetical protein